MIRRKMHDGAPPIATPTAQHVSVPPAIPAPAVLPHGHLSLSEIRGAKQELGQLCFIRMGEDTRVSAKNVPEGTEPLPCQKSLPWLRGCVERCRGGYCFRTCVARNPETPLTELHLMQPVLGLLLIFGLALLLLTAAVAVLALDAPLRTLELLSAGLALVASASCTYVGLIARNVPTHEKLNNKLKRRIDCLEEIDNNANANAADAEQLEGMTLDWLKQRRAERNTVRKLNAQLAADTTKLHAFQFKAQLLRYLSLGERQRFKRKSAELLQELRKDPSKTLAHFEEERKSLMPNGKLSIHELRHIRDIVRVTEQATPPLHIPTSTLHPHQPSPAPRELSH